MEGDILMTPATIYAGGVAVKEQVHHTFDIHDFINLVSVAGERTWLVSAEVAHNCPAIFWVKDVISFSILPDGSLREPSYTLSTCGVRQHDGMNLVHEIRSTCGNFRYFFCLKEWPV